MMITTSPLVIVPFVPAGKTRMFAGRGVGVGAGVGEGVGFGLGLGEGVAGPGPSGVIVFESPSQTSILAGKTCSACEDWHEDDDAKALGDDAAVAAASTA